ncbi:MAG TPA: 2-oxo-4-hydroxy-4-carboxy-5-ureidoimidazoline decarboxylase [bacterium]|nr:2-oxo-4-hydroxy-4-carboxy-5-ureidoimidazoline decarboxylase [bacterium]
MHHVPRQLTADELAALFEGRTRFVERLAACADPLAEARTLLARLPEEEQREALNAHPPIGAGRLSAASAREQGREDDPEVLAELARLNRAYEAKFGFRFVVFVNRRPRSEILRLLRARITHTPEEELRTGLDELVSIALDRYRSR